MTTLSYGTSNQPITITLASLADTALRESTAESNATNKYLDVLVGGKVTVAATGPATGKYINVYAYGTVDGGTLYSGNASGTDAAYTGNKKSLVLIGTIVTETVSASEEFGPWSIAAAFSGVMPEKWGIVVENQSGGALDATGTNHDINYHGVTTA